MFPPVRGPPQQQSQGQKLGKTSRGSRIRHPHVHSLGTPHPLPESLREIRLQTDEVAQISDQSWRLRAQTLMMQYGNFTYHSYTYPSASLDPQPQTAPHSSSTSARHLWSAPPFSE